MFVAIKDGKPFQGEIPDTIEVEVPGKFLKNLSFSLQKTFKKGEEGFNDALLSWMFRRGYIEKDGKK